jgi:hypothetical protein
MLYRSAWFATLLLASLQPGPMVTASVVRVHRQEANKTQQRRKAIAFLLGWNSKVLLLEKTAAGRRRYLSTIKAELDALRVTLKLPVEHYFERPESDDGRRLQAFSAETLAVLKKTNTAVANHFGAAHNLLLTLAHTELPATTRKAKLQALMAFLDMPDDLKQVPDRNLLDWANRINHYFQSCLIREPGGYAR